MITRTLTAEDPAGMCAQVFINGKRAEAVVAVAPPNIAIVLVRGANGHFLPERDRGGVGTAMRTARIRASSLDLKFNHRPCARCAGYRQVEL